VIDSTNEIYIGDYAGGSVKPTASQSNAGGSGGVSSGDAAAFESPPASSDTGSGGDPDFDLDAPANNGDGSEAPSGGDDFQL
jgi:hypothetical protein